MTSSNGGLAPLFAQVAAAHPRRVFATFDGEPITLEDLERRSAAFAASLRADGIGRGERIAVMMRNHPDVLACLIGIARSGNVWVPINPEQRGAGLRHLVDHSRPALAIVDTDRIEAVASCGADLSHVRLLDAGELPSRLQSASTFDEPFPAAADLFAIMYTSGTTGRPKGVEVTHAMMRFAGEAAIELADARDGDVLFMWEPLFHVGGAQLLFAPLLRDLELAMVRRFSASRFWDEVREANATHIHYLGGILEMLMKQPPSPRDRAHRVRVGWGAGCTPGNWRAFEARFGVRLREAYGMTETSSIATVNGDGTAGSVGFAMPWFEIAVVDAEGHAVPRGERGEIVVRALRDGCLFTRYFHDSDATARAFRGGHLHTSDVGSFDGQGRLSFHGRMTDSIRCRGENVSAWEVEHVVDAHPDVAESTIVGIAADVGEQEILLFVRPKAGRILDAATLSAWLGERLAPYQNPRYIAFVTAFERTPSQRIMKHLLDRRTDAAWDRMAAPDRVAQVDT